MIKKNNLKRIEIELLEKMRFNASKTARQRTHFNLHPALEDPVQRLVVAIDPGSYIRPHRHNDPAKWELFILLKGAAVILIFDEDGCVITRVDLSENGPVHAVEIPEKTWHTMAAEEKGSVLIEIKPGPYAPLSDKDFAGWAPEEGAEDATEFEMRFRTCEIGQDITIS
jgi:cupin fold WbuC family metalloprotein